jgi:hypothetical protein
MQEQWMRWEPIEGLNGKYDITALTANRTGLTITLIPFQGNGQAVEITFNKFVEAYRHVDESCRTALFHELSENHKEITYGSWTFLKATNSEYLTWLAHESGGWSETLELMHFCLIGDDSVVDIAADYEPTVQIISKGEIVL